MGVTDSLRCHALWVREEGAPEGVAKLEWLLLTSEAVSSQEHALKVLWIYSRRWRIEEFHKAWKSGTRVEELRARAADNLERGVVILAFVAIRLLQLQERVYPPTPRPGEPPRELAQQACDTLLTATEWRVLYLTTHKSAPPTEPPSSPSDLE
jgi:hypothetical protein